MSEFTKVLQRAQRGDSKAAEELFPLIYENLRQLAASKMAREAPGQTLQPTALVHEAWLRMGGDQQPIWRDRAQFFAAAAEAMRRILVDRARQKATAKHKRPRGQSRRMQCFLLTSRGKQRQLQTMARKLRVQYPGAIYHVMNPGD